MDLNPIYLQGQHISLEPLNESHLDDIRIAATDGELWKLFFTSVPRPDQVSQWLTTALEMQQQQRALPFAVRDNLNGKIIGSTRYCNIEHVHQRVEIGYTWYAR